MTILIVLNWTWEQSLLVTVCFIPFGSFLTDAMLPVFPSFTYRYYNGKSTSTYVVSIGGRGSGSRCIIGARKSNNCRISINVRERRTCCLAFPRMPRRVKSQDRGICSGSFIVILKHSVFVDVLANFLAFIPLWLFTFLVCTSCFEFFVRVNSVFLLHSYHFLYVQVLGLTLFSHYNQGFM